MYRAMTKEGKEVVGDLIQDRIRNKTYIINITNSIIKPFQEEQPVFSGQHHEVLPQSIAMGTGQFDKNDDEIYGSIEIDGKMSRGGDKVTAKDMDGYVPAKWDEKEACWRLPRHQDGSILAGLEIIGRQGE